MLKRLHAKTLNHLYDIIRQQTAKQGELVRLSFDIGLIKTNGTEILEMEI